MSAFIIERFQRGGNAIKFAGGCMNADLESADEGQKSTAGTIKHSDQTAAAGSLEAAVKSETNPIKRFLKGLGPGLITGASDDDPSGISTYALAGAALGFATLWTAVLTFPLMAAVQFTCAKVGMVTGKGLAGVLRRHYSRPLLYGAVICLVVANTINAG